MPNAPLLYQSYDNRAEVFDDEGTQIGEVLLLADGTYQPRVPGLMADARPTMDEAMDAVVDMHRRYRS